MAHKREDVAETFRRFIHREYPEIASDADSSGLINVIAECIFEMLEGDEENAFAGGGS